MKRQLIALALISLLVPSVYAQTPPKDIKPPFIKLQMPAEGLNIRYDLRSGVDRTKISQKLVCIFEFGGGVIYTEDNVEKSSEFCGKQQVYFTNIGKTHDLTETEGLDALDQYHVDPRATIKVFGGKSKDAAATCFYQSETN